MFRKNHLTLRVVDAILKARQRQRQGGVLKSLLLQRVGVWCEPIEHLKEAVLEL